VVECQHCLLCVCMCVCRYVPGGVVVRLLARNRMVESSSLEMWCELFFLHHRVV
jgi:hypothetical protein